jgi:prepilin peptidase CpaA
MATVEIASTRSVAGINLPDRSTAFAAGSPIQLLPPAAAAAWFLVQLSLPTLPPGCRGVSGGILTLLLTAATVTDLSSRRIRNVATYTSIIAAFSLNSVQSVSHLAGWTKIESMLGGIGGMESLAGGILCFSGAFAFFVMFRGGAGDVKLMASLGALVGVSAGFQIWLVTMVLAAAFGVAVTAATCGYRSLAWFAASYLAPREIRTIAQATSTVKDVHSALKMRLPLAPFFALATVLVLSSATPLPLAALLDQLRGGL